MCCGMDLENVSLWNMTNLMMGYINFIIAKTIKKAKNSKIKKRFSGLRRLDLVLIFANEIYVSLV